MPSFIRPSKRTAAKNRAKRANYAKVCREVDARDRGRCRMCGRAVLVGCRHHHHIVYRSRGGKDVASNLILVCGPCHRDIHDGRLKVTGTACNLNTTWRREDAL